VRRHQPFTRLRFGAVGGNGAYFRADAYADWICAGSDPGSLSYWGFHHKHHHAHDELLRPYPRLGDAIRQEPGRGNDDRDHAALYDLLHHRLEQFLHPLDLHSGLAGRARVADLLQSVIGHSLTTYIN